MARSSAYLETSRHHVFYFRIRVPKELAQHFPSTFIRRSLKTKCRREAFTRGAVLLEQVSRLFNRVAEGKSADFSALSWECPRSLSDTPPAVIIAPVKHGPKLSDVLRDYLREQKLQGVSEKTIGDKCSVTELLIRIVGDKPVDQVSRDDARRFKETALKLPPRMGQLPPQPIERMIRKAETTISTTTFNNYVKNLTTVFTYAIREGYCDRNPMAGLKIKQRVKANAQRSRFTVADLQLLFFTLGGERQVQSKPHRRWLPLLGLYTGARLNELCQLYLEDIVCIDGIYCIHIRATRPDQKLKNLTSERLVPIHTKLREHGFLEYVRHQQQLGHERLFPELSFHKRHGYGHIPSRWFAGVRGKAGMKDGEQKKDFHSFRHTVADHLKQQGVAESLIGGLLGHQTGGITFSRYGKDFAPDKLVPVVEMVDFSLPATSVGN